MYVLLTSAPLAIGVVTGWFLDRLWIRKARSKNHPPSPDAVRANGRWYTPEQIKSMSMAEYQTLRPHLLNVRPQ